MSQPEATQLQSALGKVKTHGLKYSAVSVVNVIVGQTLLLVFVYLFNNVFEMDSSSVVTNPDVLANILAVSISSIPAYYLNRAWVWGKRGKSHLTREVLPFWGFSIAGLLLSSLMVWGVTHVTDFPLAANIANILAFGLLWIFKFFALDSLIFGSHHHAPGDDELDARPV